MEHFLRANIVGSCKFNGVGGLVISSGVAEPQRREEGDGTLGLVPLVTGPELGLALSVGVTEHREEHGNSDQTAT